MVLEGRSLTDELKKTKHKTRKGNWIKMEKILQRIIKMIFILEGGPFCGKGTLCKRILEKYRLAGRARNVFHLSTGEYFRELVRNGHPYAEEIEHTMNTGEYCRDEIVSMALHDIWEKNKSQILASDLLLLDGVPRTANQVVELIPWLKKQFGADIVTSAMIKSDPEILRIRCVQRMEEANRSDDCTTIFDTRLAEHRKHHASVRARLLTYSWRKEFEVSAMRDQADSIMDELCLSPELSHNRGMFAPHPAPALLSA